MIDVSDFSWGVFGLKKKKEKHQGRSDLYGMLLVHREEISVCLLQSLLLTDAGILLFFV